MNIGSAVPFLKKVPATTAKVIKNYPGFVLGTGNEAFTQACKGTMKASKGSGANIFIRVKNAIKDGFSAAGKHNTEQIAKNGGFFKNMLKQFTGIGTSAKSGWTTAAQAGKGPVGKALAGTKGLFKGLGKAMPLIGAAFTVFSELPNIVSAFKDKGVTAGVVETGKAAAKLGAGAVGSAILGSFLGPVGAIAGWTVGSWIATKVLGKSHAEKKAEAEEAAAPQYQDQFAPQATSNSDNNVDLNTYSVDVTPYNPIFSNPYDDYRKYASF